MRTAKGLRVHVFLEVHEPLDTHASPDKHGLGADDSLGQADDLRTSPDTCSDIEMKENTKLINSASDGKDYEASRRQLFPSPHEEFDSGVVLDLHSALCHGDILNQTDASNTQCLTLIDNQETDSRALLDFLDEMSSFEPGYLTDVTFVVENKDRKRELETHCGDIFTISREEDNVHVNDNVASPNDTDCIIRIDSNGNRDTSTSRENIGRNTAKERLRSITSINLTCEGKVISSNVGEVTNNNVTSTPSVTRTNSWEVNDDTIDVISSETINDKNDVMGGISDRSNVMRNKNDAMATVDKSDVMVTLKNKHDVMVTLKDKNDVMLTTLNGEFEPLLTQGVNSEDVLDAKLSVTDKILSGFRKVAQLVMDSMVSVKTEDEDDQPYGEPS